MTFVRYSIEADMAGQQQVKVADYKPGAYESTKPVKDDNKATAALPGDVLDSTAALDSAGEQPPYDSAEAGGKAEADDQPDVEGTPGGGAAAHQVSEKTS